MSVLHSQKLFPGMSQHMDRHSSEFCLLHRECLYFLHTVDRLEKSVIKK